MKINLEIDGIAHTVDIAPAEKGGYTFLVDGTAVEADVSLLQHSGALSMYSLLSKGKSYDVILYRNKTGTTVNVNGQNFTLQGTGAPGKSKGREKKMQEGARSFRILAPMPGKVVDVKVLKDDTVKKGQALVVIEAMKMENELKAPADGVVTAVHVKPNDKVEKDAVLMDIDTGK